MNQSFGRSRLSYVKIMDQVAPPHERGCVAELSGTACARRRAQVVAAASVLLEDAAELIPTSRTATGRGSTTVLPCWYQHCSRRACCYSTATVMLQWCSRKLAATALPQQCCYSGCSRKLAATVLPQQCCYSTVAAALH